MGLAMNLRDIDVFNAIMVTGGAGAAAQLLDTSQPAVSRSLAKLEVDRAEAIDYAAAPPEGAQVVNDAVGRFALWGFPDPTDRKQLPPGAFIELHVTVDKDWQSKAQSLERLGY